MKYEWIDVHEDPGLIEATFCEVLIEVRDGYYSCVHFVAPATAREIAAALIAAAEEAEASHG